MIVSDQTIQAEELGEILKNLGRSFAKAGKSLTTYVKRNPSRALKIGPKIGEAALSQVSKIASISILVKNFISPLKKFSLKILWRYKYKYSFDKHI